MKSTNTNEIQTTGDQPVAIKSASPPLKRVLCLAMAALAGFVAHAAAATININVGNSANALTGSAYMTGGYAQAPVSYSGSTWNDISSTPNYNFIGLLDSNGNSTSVSFATTSPTAMQGPTKWSDHPNVPLLQGGINRAYNSSSGNAMVQRAMLSGLAPGGLYHIAVIGCQQDKAAGEWGIGTSSVAPASTKTIINVLPVHENWVAGDNYTMFYRVPADAEGNIYLWGKGQPGAGGYANGIVLNGLQVIAAADLPSPENQMLSFGFPGLNAVINQSTKTVTCSMYGPVNNLTPTIAISSGATCSPASGVPRDFSTPQTYTVYAENGTPNAYTVTVNRLAPTLTTRGDGKALATFSAVGGGTWTIPSGVTEVEVLVVGGGGGGGQQSSGGGAGGMYSSSSYAVTPGATVNVAVGAGGLGGNGPAGYNYYPGTSGTSSQFDLLIAYGGQLGGSYSTGGNQGGDSTDNGVTVTPGNLGGGGAAGNYAGGGGAGGVGGNVNGSSGGDGAQNAITGTLTYYAGGGAPNGNPGKGGLGGGGDGAHNTLESTPGGSGVNGLGGGGGGGWGDAGGGAGGSGVLILAYTSVAPIYTVSFESNGGSAVTSQAVTSGNTALQPSPAPTRTGYTFVEWCSDSGLTTAFNFSTPITGDRTLYAKWLLDWVVTFDSNGGSAVALQYVTQGGTATLPTPAPTRTGYTFDGWCSDSGLTTPFNFSTTITADRTVYAKWVLDWVVAFNSNGGSAVTVQYVAPGGKATVPSPLPTKTGYTFSAWCSDNGLTTPFDFETVITADTTLFAKWTINSYTLNYSADSNGTIDGLTPQTVDYGNSGTTVAAVPNAGYQFLMWSDNKTGNPRTDHNITANLSVTAIFELIPPPIAPTSVTTRGDGYTVATFTDGHGTWTIPAGISLLEVLVVGGGGGAWNDSFQSGSGAGGMYYSSSYAVTPGTSVAITIGAGATQGTGGLSQFGTQLIAYGGTKGNGYTDGGDQGGYSLDGGTTVVPGNLGMHYGPMDGNWCSGGGAGHAGYKGDAQLGGEGAACNISGSPVYYAGGGGAPSSYGASGGTGYNLGFGGSGPTDFGGPHAFSGGANTGGGGGGGWGGGGGAGGSGVVIVAYRASASAPYDTWKAGPFAYAFTDTDPSHDPDGDGLKNFQEFAFGLDPTTGSSINPITSPLNKSTHKFSYTRYAASGLTYTVWTSANLEGWTKVLPTDMTENVGPPNSAGVATVEVTLTNPPGGDKLFVRVRAE